MTAKLVFVRKTNLSKLLYLKEKKWVTVLHMQSTFGYISKMNIEYIKYLYN